MYRGFGPLWADPSHNNLFIKTVLSVAIEFVFTNWRKLTTLNKNKGAQKNYETEWLE